MNKIQNTITPEQVVEAARDPSSPLHAAFAWCLVPGCRCPACQHRLAQARILIRGIVYIAEEDVT